MFGLAIKTDREKLNFFVCECTTFSNFYIPKFQCKNAFRQKG